MTVLASGRKSFTPSTTYLVGKDVGAPFPTITGALQIAALIATPTIRPVVYVSPGVYDEDLVVPDFVSLCGIAAGVQVRGSNSAGGVIIDIGQGISFEKITVSPRQQDKDVGVRVRDATMILTGVIPGGPGVVGTLVLNGKTGAGGDDETFIFAGEATPAAVVAVVNATAVNVFAYVRDITKVAIISIYNTASWPGQLIVYGTGTANTALGFGAVDIIQTRAAEATIYMTNISVIGKGGISGLSGGKKITYCIELEERTYGSVVFSVVSLMGSTGDATGRGMVINRGSILLASLVVTGNTAGLGIEFKYNAATGNTQALLGVVEMVDNALDIDGPANTKVMALVHNDGLTVGASGVVYVPSQSLDTLAGKAAWLFSNYASFKDVMETVFDYTRRTFIHASEAHIPAAAGATLVDRGAIPQGVLEYDTAADETATFIRKHLYNNATTAQASLKVRLICSVSDNGGVLDVVRVVVNALAVGATEDLTAAAAQSIASNVDVSAWVADEMHVLEFTINAAGALPANDEVLLLGVTRDGAGSADNYAHEFHVWGIETQW